MGSTTDEWILEHHARADAERPGAIRALGRRQRDGPGVHTRGVRMTFSDAEVRFILSDGREAQIPASIDRSALKEFLDALPSRSRDAVLHALKTMLPSHSQGETQDQLISVRFHSSDPILANLLARLYGETDARTTRAHVGARSPSPEQLPFILALQPEQVAWASGEYVACIVRRPQQPHDILLLRSSATTPEELHQAIRRVMSLRRGSVLVPQSAEYHDVRLQTTTEHLPASWRARLVQALEQLQGAPTQDVPPIGRVRAVTFRFRPEA